MKIIKKCIVLTLLTLVALSSFSITVNATVDAIWTGQFTIQVNDDTFDVWGYSSDMAVLHLSLPDMAYMLRGTSAAFDIRRSASESHQFWIVRDAVYTPTGNELQSIPERFATRSDMGFLFGWEGGDRGFLRYPEQTIVIGIDGEDYPETFFAIRTIEDIDNTFFLVSDLAYILGFENIITTDRWHPGRYHDDFVEGLERIFLTETREAAALPQQDAFLLNVMIRINGNFGGHWVCETYFESDEINENVVWPVEIIFSNDSIGFPYFEGVAPGRLQWEEALELQRNSFEPLSMRIREDGMTLLYVDNPQSCFVDYLIVIDPHLASHETITLYIGDSPHTMRWYRMGWIEPSDRYTAQPTEDGGIMLRYRLNRWAFNLHEEMDFMIFRATEELEFGWSDNPLNDNRLTLIHRQIGVDLDDRIIFEFVDNAVEHGQVYYYSLWRSNGNWFENITPSNEPPFGSIRIDVNVLLGLPASDDNEAVADESDETEEISATESTGTAETGISVNTESPAAVDTSSEDSEQLRDSTNIWIWIMVPIIALVVLLALFLYRRFMRKMQ